MAFKRKNSDGTWSMVGGKGAGDYSTLSDVDVTGLVDGCTVRYDSGSSTWKPVMYIDDTGAATTTNVWSASKVKSITDALSSVASIKVVASLPATPDNNTMYYVGTTSPYHIYLRANNITYDMGTTQVDLSEYEKLTNKVTSWQSTPDNTHYPSEKLVKDSINAKASAVALSSHTGNTGNPHDVTKAQVGLGNCDNTSDLNKPISTATQTALDAKQDALPVVFLQAIPANVNLVKSNKDAKGVYLTYTWDLTVPIVDYPAKWVSNLSADYLSRTLTVYGSDKTSVITTYSFTRTLDEDGNLLTETLNLTP